MVNVQQAERMATWALRTCLLDRLSVKSTAYDPKTDIPHVGQVCGGECVFLDNFFRVKAVDHQFRGKGHYSTNTNKQSNKQNN
jgi:hypothetical protein